MKALTVDQIREKYQSFFESKDHLRLPSFSLVPKDDPSILLINAGMTPMKQWFTGTEKPPHPRVTTCQKCVRTPDIENVGVSQRHGTFFEMLGNFSFGDYFKEGAIPWAWEFLTEWLEMDPELLSVTVFMEDDEAYNIWRDVVGIPTERIYRFGKEDNFWEHGTGPCGPCSEIFYDRGMKYSCGSETCQPGCDCDRFVEIWNLVFTQFDRQEDGSYIPLAQKNIDTGAGLERLATVMQSVDNLFEIDTVRAILDQVTRLAKITYGQDKKSDIAIRVITDHIRTATMLIGDGVTASNTGAGYVLRRIIRRAARFGRLLGIEGGFLADLAQLVIKQSGEAYPELVERREFILMNIRSEEARFAQTIRQGSQYLDEALSELRADSKNVLPGEVAFRLHDTYGFPYDLTAEIAAEEGFEMDPDGFEVAMKEQQERARKAQLERADSAWTSVALPEEVDHIATEFIGYDTLESEAILLHALTRDEEGYHLHPTLHANGADGTEAYLIFNRTPFYAESGGQVADIGTIEGEHAQAKVVDCQKTNEGIYLHKIRLMEGEIIQGSSYKLGVDRARRMATARNHTATHLLHRALRDVLGSHVVQAGSYVDPDRLRFDFHHMAALTRDEIDQVEAQVNESILADYPVDTEVMSVAEAKNQGAMALFDEKYGDAVRVIRIGDYSMELCGGTHLKHSSQTAYFRVVSEQSIASGVRRIEAATGGAAMHMAHDDQLLLRELSDMTKSPPKELAPRMRSMQSHIRDLEQALRKAEQAQAQEKSGQLVDEAVAIGEAKVLMAQVQVSSMDALRDMAERLRDQLEPAVVLLGMDSAGKAQFVCTVSKSLVQTGIKAGDLVKIAAGVTGGGGGGRPDMAQAGGKDATKLPEAIEVARTNAIETLEAM